MGQKRRHLRRAHLRRMAHSAPLHEAALPAHIAFLRADGKTFPADGILELLFKFHVGTFMPNMMRMRVILNNPVGYDAHLRQKQHP